MFKNCISANMIDFAKKKVFLILLLALNYDFFLRFQGMANTNYCFLYLYIILHMYTYLEFYDKYREITNIRVWNEKSMTCT